MPKTSPILLSSLEVMKHAIEHLKEGTPKDAKFAVLHADNAVELVLKEIARFKGIRLIDIKGQSIGYYDCINKLQEREVLIPELPDIDLLHTERNSIYHLGSQPDQKKSEWLVYDVALNFMNRICKDELKYDITRFSKAFKLSPETKQEIELTRSEIVNKYLVDSEAALNSKMFDATVVFSYTGIEALLRESISLQIRSHVDMMRKLVSEKLLSTDLLKNFMKLRDIRNKVVHGVSKATNEEATFALSVFRRMVDEIGLPLELKCKTCGVQFNSGIVMSRKAFETSKLIQNTHRCPRGHVHTYDKNDYIIRL